MRALVIGGGIGGLAAALALKRIGVEVRVFEQAPQIQEVGAGLSLWSNAMTALERLGVAHLVMQQGSPYRYGRAITDQGKLISISDLYEVNPRVPCVMVYRADLQRVLLHSFGVERVSTNARCVAVSQTPESVQAEFADGTTEQADILVGADGIHSVVRAQIFGPSELRYSGRTCWRGIGEFDPEGLPENSTVLILGKGFKMGVFRCGPGRVYWFFVKVAAAGGRDDEAGPRAYLLRQYGDCTSLLMSTLSATNDARIMRNDLFDRPPSWPWGTGRITLLGDAIHSTTPNLGQGACLAIEDGVFLANSVRRHESIESALRHYEQRRRKRTAMVNQASWQSGRFLVLERPALIALRNTLMRSRLGQWQSKKLMSRLLNFEIPELCRT